MKARITGVKVRQKRGLSVAIATARRATAAAVSVSRP